MTHLINLKVGKESRETIPVIGKRQPKGMLLGRPSL